ncbi:MAG: hypothetical protein FWC06_06985, partial [Treponema sp.]|nr:hypothetical protein [Treponema sp.]
MYEYAYLVPSTLTPPSLDAIPCGIRHSEPFGHFSSSEKQPKRLSVTLTCPYILLIQCNVSTMSVKYCILLQEANMTESTNLNIRIDKELKEQAECFFSELGLNMSSAFNIFVR